MNAAPDQSDRLLVDRIRGGEARAWEELISRYEGRLLAFVDSRLHKRAASEDVVQETFLGFLTSLPNYDPSTPVEAFLFSIAAHKLTDLLRREGRRPTIPLMPADSTSGTNEPRGPARMASSLVRSQENRETQSYILVDCLRELIDGWISNGEFERLKCMELLFVVGLPNKEAAEQLDITEQAVANHKHFVVAKLKDAAKRAAFRNVDLSVFGIE